jgi:chemotaxis protein methyltransferase CheR
MLPETPESSPQVSKNLPVEIKSTIANQASPGGITPPDYKLGYGDYLRFRDLVLERTGLHYPEKKRSDLEIGLLKSFAESPFAAANGNGNLDAYYNLLRDRENSAAQTEMKRLIDTLTIGETHFFRDESQFNALANEVLPSVIARKRAGAAAVGPDIQPQLRIWSVGCATGEEPYSLAIMLKELLPDIDNWYILILATDISSSALKRAQQSIYSDWSFRENRARALRPRYFTRYRPMGGTPTKDRYRLRDDIRQMVTFAPLNLIEDNYPSIANNTMSMDLVLCRNVTIYFTEDTTRRVILKLHDALIDGGWLVVGHSEPSLTIYREFQTHIFSGTVLYQKIDRTYPYRDVRSTRIDLSEKIKPQTAPLRPPPAQPKKVTAALSAPTPPPAEPDHYEVAGVLLNKGNTEEAIEELHRKIANDSRFAPAHSMLGRAYANLGHWDKARYWCQNALKLDALLPEAYYVLGLIYEHEDNVPEAIEMFKKAIYLDREAPLLHFHLAMLYKKAGQLNNAKKACQNTVRVLAKWPPASIVPDSGGATAKHLLDAARRILNELETN